MTLGHVARIGYVRLSDILIEETNGRRQLDRKIASSAMLRRVALVRTDVSEELRTSIIRVTRIGELVGSYG
jgi:hypothetical protein